MKLESVNHATYIHQADIVYVEKASGIYMVGKDRTHLRNKGGYVSTDTVIDDLNGNLKIVLCKNWLEDPIDANFNIE